MCKEQDFEALNPKWDVFRKPSLQGSEIYVEEVSEVVDGSKETASSRHKTDTHIIPHISQRLWHHAQDLQRFKPDRTPALSRGITHKSPY